MTPRTRVLLVLLLLTGLSGSCRPAPSSSQHPKTKAEALKPSARPESEREPLPRKAAGMGPFAVGVSLRLLEDPTRSSRPNAAVSSSHPRRLLIATWYPALQTDASSPARVADFLDLSSRVITSSPNQATFLKQVEEGLLRATYFDAFGQDDLAPYLFEGTASKKEKRELAELLETRTLASFDASMVPGLKYPVVVYHPGYASSYFENYRLCEALASRGYVVVAGGFYSPDEQIPRIGTFEDSLADLQFLFGWLGQREYIDDERRSLVGYSFGAQVALAYAARDQGLSAVVSLDSTFERLPLAKRSEHTRAQYVQRHRVRSPILFFTQHQGTDKSWMRSFTHAPRWNIGLSSGGHDLFTATGASSRHHPTTPAKSVYYRKVVREVVAFLDYARGLSPAYRFEPGDKELVDRGFFPEQVADFFPALGAIFDQVNAGQAETLVKRHCVPPAERGVWVCHQMVDLLLNAGHVEQAGMISQATANRYPENWYISKIEARVRVAKGELEGAARAYERAIERLRESKSGMPPRAFEFHLSMLQAELLRTRAAAAERKSGAASSSKGRAAKPRR